ncbi:hypothetical protein ACJ2A9_00985 [Anaerobacillus sp. MEB173]|uniref:hypothetical protein n=1 Tax=Anaerobacillus sp. MEB173 TaxID=3383345 RepID=UPI003F9064D3
MSACRNENPLIYKWIAIICLILIPLAEVLAVVFNLNRDPLQFIFMTAGFLALSWLNWMRFKEKSEKA